jgi:hypothetical protein
MIPVIYIHLGSIPSYLVKSIEQAARFNRDIVLITDVAFTHPAVTTCDVKDFNSGVNDFEAAYVHMSSNTEAFEKICIKRWFILRNFVNKQQLETVYYSDSDVMIYADVKQLYPNYAMCDAAYTLAENQENFHWAASACCSYWKRSAINDFCEFIMNAYVNGNESLNEKWNFHQSNKVAGGICDMTLLYLFAKEIKFESLSKVKEDVCFDHNMVVGDNFHKDEYETESRLGEELRQKKITWKNGIPFGYNKVYGKSIRFAVLTEYAKLEGTEKSLLDVMSHRLKRTVKKIISKGKDQR